MEEQLIDRRQQRTREAIHQAFITLATNRRYDDFSVTELIEKAAIGKSTFYEHYRGKDDVLHALMGGMLSELAAAAAGTLEPASFRGLLEHFWDNRRLGKSVFGKQLGATIQRRLTILIAEAIEANGLAANGQSRARASYAAAGQIGLLYAWLSGEFSADTDSVAAALTGAAVQVA